MCRNGLVGVKFMYGEIITIFLNDDFSAFSIKISLVHEMVKVIISLIFNSLLVFVF